MYTWFVSDSPDTRKVPSDTTAVAFVSVLAARDGDADGDAAVVNRLIDLGAGLLGQFRYCGSLSCSCVHEGEWTTRAMAQPIETILGCALGRLEPLVRAFARAAMGDGGVCVYVCERVMPCARH